MTTTTQTTAGVSYNRISNQPYLKPKEQLVRPFNVGENKAMTAAQAMTVIGYGDTTELPCRSLHFKVECEDYQDFAACIRTIDSYNEFDSDRILRSTRWTLNRRHFMNEDNPNNGCSFFKFEIGRESSPVFYVHYNGKFNRKVVTDTQEVPATQTEGAKTLIYWQEYSEVDFKFEMQQLADQIGADEFSIEEREIYPGYVYYKARFWFD